MYEIDISKMFEKDFYVINQECRRNLVIFTLFFSERHVPIDLSNTRLKDLGIEPTLKMIYLSQEPWSLRTRNYTLSKKGKISFRTGVSQKWVSPEGTNLDFAHRRYRNLTTGLYTSLLKRREGGEGLPSCHKTSFR